MRYFTVCTLNPFSVGIICLSILMYLNNWFGKLNILTCMFVFRMLVTESLHFHLALVNVIMLTTSDQYNN